MHTKPHNARAAEHSTSSRRNHETTATVSHIVDHSRQEEEGVDWSATRRNTNVAGKVGVIAGVQSGRSVVDVNACTKLNEGKGNNSNTKHDGALQQGIYRVGNV